MARRVLIADATATNRIAYKAALSSARYDVTAVGSLDEAAPLLETGQADIFIMDDSVQDPGMPIRMLPVPTLVVSEDLGSEARARWLAAGAEMVLHRPVERPWLLANLRALARRHESGSELARQLATAQRLGFADGAPGYVPRLRLVTVASDRLAAQRATAGLGEALGMPITVMTPGQVLSADTGDPAPDVVLLPADGDSEEALWLLAELRSNPWTRRSEIVFECEPSDTTRATRALDMGASAVIARSAGLREREILAARALGRKAERDTMRRRMDDSLRMAARDHLTGLFNRRYAMQYLDELSQHHGGEITRFGVILIDVDHFKRINDRYGHGTGDRILVAVADRLQENLREHDLVSRFGGEEFLAVLSDANRDEVEAIAERLRASIGDTPFDVEGGTIDVTISLGAAIGSDRPAEAIALADGALYSAKDDGRNCVRLAGPICTEERRERTRRPGGRGDVPFAAHRGRN